MLVFLKQSMGTSTAGSTTGHVITGSCRVSAVLTPRLYARWSMNETFYQIYGIHFISEKRERSKEGRGTRKGVSTSLMKKRYCSAQQRSYCRHRPEISVWEHNHGPVVEHAILVLQWKSDGICWYPIGLSLHLCLPLTSLPSCFSHFASGISRQLRLIPSVHGSGICQSGWGATRHYKPFLYVSSLFNPVLFSVFSDFINL